MKRRDFLKLGGLTTTTALMGACTVPRVRSYYVPYVEQPEDALPGVPDWYATTCTMCEAGCGIQARVLGGRASKIEGTPNNPINEGKTCALGQSGLQVLYHPDRVRGPMKRTGPRGQAQFAPIGWDEALALLAAKLRPVAATGAIDMVTRPLNGTLGLVLDRFTRALNIRGPVQLDLTGRGTLLKGVQRGLGFTRLPDYDLSEARYVLGFGADLFGTWLSPVRQGVGYGRMRHGRPGIRGKLVQIEPRMSVTGAAADRWIPITPGTEGLLALTLGHLLTHSDALTPELVAPEVGVSARTIRHLADELATMRPAIALGGGAIAAQSNGVESLAAIHALNQVLGSVGVLGGVRPSAPAPWREFNAFAPPSFQDMLALVERMKRGQVQVLLVHQADPVYQVPPVVGFTGAIAEVPFIVSFSSFVDDTTAYADLILPDHTYLESWGIVLPEPNPGRPVASSLQPVVSPVFDTRPVGDVLISVARAIGGPIKAALKWPSYIDLVRTTWASLPGQTGESWMTVRQSGGWVGPALPVPASPSRAIGLPTTVPKASFAGDPHAFPFLFLPYPSIPLHDGRSANLPWQQELPDTMTTGVWSSWLEVNPKTAQELDLAEGDPVEVSSPYGMLRVRIHLYPGLHPDVVAMPLGQGHTTYGRYAANRGANALSLVGPELVTGSGDLAWASTRVRLRKVDDAPRFTKVERRDWLPESHEAPGYLSLEDLTRQRWPWDGTHVTE